MQPRLRRSSDAMSVALGAVDGPRLKAERDAAVQAARVALGDTTRLTRLLTTLSETGSLDGLMDRTLGCLSELFSADIAALLTAAEPAWCGIQAAVGVPEDMLAEWMSSAPTTALDVALRGSVCATGASGPPGFTVDRRFHELGVGSAVWLPMPDSGAVVAGVIVLGRCTGVPFTATDTALLVVMARRIGTALDQARQSRQLEHLAQSARAIGQSLDETVILEEVVRAAPDVLGTEAAIIVLLDKDGHRTYAESGLSEADLAAWGQPVDVDVDTLAAACGLSVGQSIQIADLAGSLDRRLPWPAERRMRSTLAVPLIFGGQVQGVLLAFRLTIGSFAPHTVQLATLYAGHIAAALENARLLDAVRTSDDRFRALIRSVSDVITILAADGIIRYVSPASLTTWGYASDEVLGQNFFAHVHPEDLAAAHQLVREVQVQPGATLTGGLRLRHAARGWRDFEVILSNGLDDPALDGIITTCHDVTERKAAESRLSQLAFRDPLSGLANRALFMDRLEHSLDRAARGDHQSAVLFIDLDNFKRVNDTLGHAAGDAVLIEVATRIKRCLRTQDTAARLGGDEFTVLIEDIPNLGVATALATRIQQALQVPMQLNGQHISPSASIGVALSTGGQKIDELLHRADAAMYRAKNGGKGQVAVL